MQAIRSGCWALALLLATGLPACVKPEAVTEIQRGPLRCTEFVERRRVNNYWWEVFVNDKPFTPDGFPSNKVGQCQASRNPEVKVLVLLYADSCWMLRLDGDRPVLTQLERPPDMDSIEQFKSAALVL